jgi:spore coat protein A
LCGPPASSTPASTATPPRAPLHPNTLARFVDPLPIPAVLAPDGTRPDPLHPGVELPFYRVTMREASVKVHRDLPPTSMWSYGGTVPGPTIETRRGHPLLVEWVNDLPDKHFLPIDHSLCGAGSDRPESRTVVHVHGAKAPPESDGYPEDWYAPGHSAVYRYPNEQDATMLWYHDHTMGIERLNQYAGLFGVFFIRDDVEDGLSLPKNEEEVPLVITDRLFDARAQLVYPTTGMADSPWVSEVYGDALLVNGTLFPYLDVAPRRYRFRVLNASNSRFYYLSLSNAHRFHQIGTDQGLLPTPAELETFTLSPAERADLVVDFSALAGQTLTLKSQALELMQFRVSNGPVKKSRPLPATLRSVPRIAESAAAKTRMLTLNEYKEPNTNRMLMLLNATRFREPITERPLLDSVEIWTLVNLTEDTHPIHLHLVRFQILDRQQFDADEYLRTGKFNLLGKAVPPPPNEAGWKDTVRADPELATRIIVKFEGFPGRYVWHCHLLEHSANEMMRPFEVVRA